jgi:hypothetical protein
MNSGANGNDFEFVRLRRLAFQIIMDSFQVPLIDCSLSIMPRDCLRDFLTKRREVFSKRNVQMPTRDYINEPIRRYFRSRSGDFRLGCDRFFPPPFLRRNSP